MVLACSLLKVIDTVTVVAELTDGIVSSFSPLGTSQVMRISWVFGVQSWAMNLLK